MPGTASDYNVDVWSVDSSIDGWGRLMRDQYNRFNRWDYALAAYNAGAGNVIKYNGIPPFNETQDYVRIILGNANMSTGGGVTIPPTVTGKTRNAMGLVLGFSIAAFAFLKINNKIK